MASFHIVSEDVSNREASWCFAGVYRGSAIARVEIRANAYERQSYAKVSVWKAEGWAFHTAIPTHEWYDRAPSYVTPREEIDEYVFHWLRDELLERLALALWGVTEPVNLKVAKAGEVVTYG